MITPHKSHIINNLPHKQRNSNLELYRIIVMLLIVAHHYVVNSGLMDNLMLEPLTPSNIVMLIFGAWGKTGINCFIMITGWFMCKSSISGEKLFKLYAQITLYAIIIYAIFCVSGHETFTPLTAINKFFPIKGLHHNFTSCFLVFYLLIPFINKFIRAINKRELEIIICILLVCYSVLPHMLSFFLSFNYVTWFCIIYLIAAYIRFYGFPMQISHNAWGWISLILIIGASISVIVLAYLYKTGHMSSFSPFYFISDSNKLLALAIGVSSFMFFKDMRIPHSRLINIIGGTTFGVLLIHANSDTMRRWLWQETVDCAGHFTESVSFTLSYATISVIIIFIVCSGIDWFRGQFIEPRLIAWFKAIKSKYKQVSANQ